MDDVAQTAGAMDNGVLTGFCAVVRFARMARSGAKPKASWKNQIRSEPCSYCGGPGGTVDHIDPRSRGGVKGQTNATGSCLTCNLVKSSMPLLLFLVAGGMRSRWTDQDRATSANVSRGRKWHRVHHRHWIRSSWVHDAISATSACQPHAEGMRATEIQAMTGVHLSVVDHVLGELRSRRLVMRRANGRWRLRIPPIY